MYQEVVIPREVKVEAVDRGREGGFPDALPVENAVREGGIRVEEVELTPDFTNMAQVAGLKVAEAAVIHYAYKNNAISLLDEDSARIFARALGIPIRGSLGVILEGLRRGLLSRVEALKALENLSEIMYLNADVYRIVRNEMEKS